MKEFKIYTCGRMSGLSYGQQMIWRKGLETKVKSLYEEIHGTSNNITFINPPEYFSYEEKLHQSEREIKEWELSQVCNSDVVVMNLDGIVESTGSHFELGAVSGANLVGNKQIKVIAIGEIPTHLHPWIGLCWLRYEKEITSAAEYIVKYLLI